MSTTCIMWLAENRGNTRSKRLCHCAINATNKRMNLIVTLILKFIFLGGKKRYSTIAKFIGTTTSEGIGIAQNWPRNEAASHPILYRRLAKRPAPFPMHTRYKGSMD